MSQHKPKILVVFYSMYGHIFRMAKAVGEGVREPGGEPILKQVAELVPEESWSEGVKEVKEAMKAVPVADPRIDRSTQKSLNLAPFTELTQHTEAAVV